MRPTKKDDAVPFEIRTDHSASAGHKTQLEPELQTVKNDFIGYSYGYQGHLRILFPVARMTVSYYRDKDF